ncbi:lytic transglycosylase domain-containing protein [Paenibacillus pasadenensis]|uniref:lytic transglycosylase domain-containing protein n=1 Tax=Paenibacillus pasadenensis TaxID=217090 RepID=UPI0020414EDE|nr:lytic transglycosylase domain-containing protein [Paenibacillus pasadenensis]MCM3746965.1 lytic transglycosylase domain-containing protein [Paenibacillus pasadenensis]
MSWGWFARKRVLLLVLTGFIALLFLKSDWMGRMMYPIAYMQSIETEASINDVDPYLIAAIIRVESNFKTDKVSSKGAGGVMQLMPETADWIIEMAKFDAATTRETVVGSAELSIKAGSWYVHALHDQFKGNSVAAVAAYNAGPGKVRQWMRDKVWDGTMEHLDQVPYGETRHYVQRVDYYYKKYKSLYPEWSRYV